MKAFVLWLIRVFPWLSADYRQRRIKPKQKCPACGAYRKHDMKFDPNQKVVLLICVCCEAVWGYDPIVKTEKWQKPNTEGGDERSR